MTGIDIKYGSLAESLCSHVNSDLVKIDTQLNEGYEVETDMVRLIVRAFIIQYNQFFLQLVAALSMTALPCALNQFYSTLQSALDATNREHVTLITWKWYPFSVFTAQLRQTNANEMFCWNFDYSFYYIEL